MATFVQAFSTPSDTSPVYVNLDQATQVRAAQDPNQAEATSKFYAIATIDGRDLFFDDLDGFDDADGANTAIEAALGL